MPALVNMSVGSSLITMGAESTILWPFSSKNDKNLSLICDAVIRSSISIKIIP